MFRKAVLRLTLWYLLILMFLSISFSVLLYQSSVNELNTLQDRQNTLLLRRPTLMSAPGFTVFNDTRIQEIQQSKQNIETNLIYFNFIILLLGGGVSYLLARRTLQPIQEAHEAQNEFTTNASHELRTPLTAMKSEIEVALRDPHLTLTDSKTLHKSVLEEIEKLEDLASGLLRLARRDTKQKASFTKCEVKEIVSEAISRVQAAAQQKGVKIKATVDDSTLTGECWSLIDLITILLDNAIKYSPKKSTITVSTDGKGHGAIAISVQDEGAGITADDLPHIFDRFYQADQSRSKETKGGYGLGLSIAKQIAELHTGHIEVKTVLGKGTTFTVVLPVQPGAKWPHKRM